MNVCILIRDSPQSVKKFQLVCDKLTNVKMPLVWMCDGVGSLQRQERTMSTLFAATGIPDS